ncbi:hypothetical protein BO94DRAFT_536386 [Aspergillus sclerotioniger CBS 115572]|uniref:Zn(2)-C6 fungal-type domain-containing protein n=1 Tax=Aspergillus sclerotioniger CBS 115572 TaxID=1450535 RepID=A0A317WEP5_9EURO|nr:hypothetical protein BO94DRAFT_536386 [Aspergillus sclerotioniger CBS 115572]PWY83697.1 hypothetical protein BO94DRAFT_536386 [Aspergillus sclerotioniger CBS 115572]
MTYGPISKRRKVRKGTRSCWECKRRKVRCIFSSPASLFCDHCRRRGSTCISQEHPDSPDSSTGNAVEVRLHRVEKLIQQLISPAGSEERSEAPLTPSTLEEREEAREEVFPVPPAITITASQHDIARELVAAWPSQAELDIIYTLPAGLSAYLHCGICAPSAQDLPSPREMLKLPPPGSHPVLVARKLLVLGIFLQGVRPSTMHSLGDLGNTYRETMSRVVNRAIRLVTTNDNLTSSVEGIECIMFEGLYQNYAGNLHQAWMAVRRATAIAQMMALHRGLASPSLKTLEPETRAILDADHMCFRLVQMDRYLSLMLGLPPTSLEIRFLAPKAMEECQPIDRMQRIHCAVAGRILQRSDADVNNLANTHDIDQQLQKAAAEVPPQWWLIPGLTSSNSDGLETIQDTIRLMDQFTHYQLLLRLHLPYMLRSSSDHRYDPSKLTIITVSREILSRYIAFRTSNPAHYYCRGTDFLAFVATTVLCLAHIDSYGQCPIPGTVMNFLAHSRPSDRGTMERTYEIIETMARSGTDGIAMKLARVIHHLLAVEATAANGTIYQTSTSKGSEGEFEYDGKLTNGGTSLHVYIPYFGTIDFEQKPSHLSTFSAAECVPQMVSFSPKISDPEFSGQNDWDLQGVDVALFNSLFGETATADADEAWVQWEG